jgi:nicotinamidase-related amidase
VTDHESVLILMDYQDGILEFYPSPDGLERTRQVLAAARGAGLPVVFVVVGFRPGHPEISPNHPNFSRLKGTSRLVNPSVVAELAPAESEPVVVKHRVSAFVDTDLSAILRGYQAKHLILAGVTTSGCVLSTTRIAADLDYRLTILRDCCWDAEQDVHAFLMDRILSRQATITTSDAFIAALYTEDQ